MPTLIFAVDRADLAPFPMSDRFRHEVTYFMSLPGEAGVPKLPTGEYWIHRSNARQWLDDGVFYLVSPLDEQNRTEIELSEEQEAWLEWMVTNHVEHVRVVTA